MYSLIITRSPTPQRWPGNYLVSLLKTSYIPDIIDSQTGEQLVTSVS